MPDLDMSPYGAFVWPAWGVTVATLGFLIGRAAFQARRWKEALERIERGARKAHDE